MTRQRHKHSRTAVIFANRVDSTTADLPANPLEGRNLDSKTIPKKPMKLEILFKSKCAPQKIYLTMGRTRCPCNESPGAPLSAHIRPRGGCFLRP